MTRTCFRCGQAILYPRANSKPWIKLVEISDADTWEGNFCSRECAKEQLERDKIADEQEAQQK
jgi:hypothetical protein